MGKQSRVVDVAKFREIRETNAGDLASEAIYEAVSKAIEGVPVTFNETSGKFEVSIQVFGATVNASAETPWLALRTVAATALERLDFRGFSDSEDEDA